MEPIPMYTPVRDYMNHQKSYDHCWKTVVQKGDFIMGDQIFELEHKLAQYAHSTHCITMGSGTDALLASLLALNVKPGDKVITVPFTWISTAEVVSLLGATPVFIDIEDNTLNMNPTLLQQYLSNDHQIKAIIVVNLYGQMADYTLINNIAAQYNIPVVEDAAQSFGARRNTHISCNSTTISCTSFYPTKPLGCYGDGGACFTNNNTLAQSLRQIRSHGKGHRLGFNGRLDTIQAAILLVKLNHLDEQIKQRIKHSHIYNNAFSKLNWLKTPTHIGTHVMAQYTLRLQNRDALYTYLQQLNIGCAIFYPVPLHHLPQYKSQGPFPVTEQACKEVISIPVFPELTENEQQTIIKSIIQFEKKYK